MSAPETAKRTVVSANNGSIWWDERPNVNPRPLNFLPQHRQTEQICLLAVLGELPQRGAPMREDSIQIAVPIEDGDVQMGTI